MPDEETAKEIALAISKFSDIINKLAGPLAEEFGMMLGDKVRVYRVKNWIRTVEKTQRLLREAGLSANAVPPRLFLPIMEASSIEDDETLQDMWAGLLATASQETDSGSPAFIETLKQLTPDEARYLEVICPESLKLYGKEGLTDSRELLLSPFAERDDSPAPKEYETYERLGLIRREYLVDSRFHGDEAEVTSEVDGYYEFTGYAVRFLDACHGPLPAK